MATKQERIVLDTARRTAPKDCELAIDRGGKHPFLLIALNGRTARMPFACTPRSDDKCVENFARQGVRRALATLALAA